MVAVSSVVAVVSVSAQAASSFSVSCRGAVSNNQITWSESVSGGNAPYASLWSGDSRVAGSTSTSITAIYPVNGTYTAVIQATDASSTIATSTCSAAVNYNVVPTATSTLNVFLDVNNVRGGSDVGQFHRNDQWGKFQS